MGKWKCPNCKRIWDGTEIFPKEGEPRADWPWCPVCRRKVFPVE